jgi:hypothetical protein
MLVNLLVYVNAIPELMPMPDSVRYKVSGRVWTDPTCTQLILCLLQLCYNENEKKMEFVRREYSMLRHIPACFD